MNYEISKKNIIIDAKDFDLEQTLDCGQAFRWEKVGNNVFEGIAKGRFLRISSKDGKIIFHNTSLQDFEQIWIEYFDLDTDYCAIKQKLCADKTLSVACDYAGGIRILRQDAWETVCSFIISQNNNIPRIKGIIARLCENFGQKIDGGYAFPTAQALCDKSIEDLAPLRAGFRAKYIIDTAQKFADNQIVCDEILSSELELARNILMKIKGVGPKVADCALLFGFYKLDAFPKDVWIKRVMEKYYPDGLPEFAVEYGGIAQQYLFHYERMVGKDEK
ncbi:MAG: DNA glycosylase [Oscillospiraceae bacterium]|nr:DNA glycosylase [Oscillospiraceae bacterium]